MSNDDRVQVLTDDMIATHLQACLIKFTPSAKHSVVRVAKKSGKPSVYGETIAVLQFDHVFNGTRVLAYRMSCGGCALLVCGDNVTSHYFIGFRTINLGGIYHLFHYDGHRIKVYVELEQSGTTTALYNAGDQINVGGGNQT